MQFDAPYGHALIAKYAMATRRHMYEYGTTIEQLAEIAVSTRYNAWLNPDAYYRDPITIDDVQSSRDDRRPAHEAALLHPLRRRRRGRAHVRGAGARTSPSEPVWVLGTGETTQPHDDERVGGLHRVPRRPLAASSRSSGPASRPTDIDICQIYDAFTSMVLLSLEALGFCEKGEGGPFVEDGKLRARRRAARPTPTAAASRTATPACAACS